MLLSNFLKPTPRRFPYTLPTCVLSNKHRDGMGRCCRAYIWLQTSNSCACKGMKVSRGQESGAIGASRVDVEVQVGDKQVQASGGKYRGVSWEDMHLAFGCVMQVQSALLDAALAAFLHRETSAALF